MGGLVGTGLGGAAPSELPPRTVALRRLRALHAERDHLRLRRIEVRLELDARRHAITQLEEAAAHEAQGPAEQVVFERSVRAAAELAIESREIEQRLYRIKRHISMALADAVTTVLRS